MNERKTLCKISLVSIALILLLVSTALAATENNTGNATINTGNTTIDTGNATIKDNYISSSALATAEKRASLQITETQITTSGSAYNPAIYGNRIVWEDSRSGTSNIYMYDLSTKKQTQITTSGDAGEHAIYGNKIVWHDSRSGTLNIYMYDLSTKKETQITTSGSAIFPDIYGNKIIWEDDSSGNSDIYMYDISTKKETQITNSPDDQTCPAIYGNRIVWEDDGGQDDGSTNHGIYMYDISTKKKMKISAKGSAYNPAIYGNKIVWEDSRSGNYDIYMYDLSTKKQTQITSSPDDQRYPVIYGNRIVWEDDGGKDGVNHGIYMYDISTKQKMKISKNGPAYSPAIYGDDIVWQYGLYENSDIYMVTVSSEPQPKPPVAVFSASPTSGKTPLKVQFTDKSTESPTSWKWSFGDGTYSTAKNPAHTYGKAGKYTVALTASNSAGSNTLKKSGYVNVAAPLKAPVAAFSASPRSGKAPLNVKFTDKSTDAYYWSWNFGDKSTSTAQNPTHKYTKAGKYTVSLTVKNAAGSNTAKKTNYITVK